MVVPRIMLHMNGLLTVGRSRGRFGLTTENSTIIRHRKSFTSSVLGI